MSDQNVEYTLSLKDLLTQKIKGAGVEVNKFEGSLNKAAGSAKHLGLELAGAIGIGFALYKGAEFIHESTEAMHGLEQAEAQVHAGLESTRSIAGLTFDDLEEGAKEAAHNLRFTQGAIEDMQAVMLTFPGVTKQTFGDASMAIEDMSTRLHKGLNETAIMVGKALQDPEKGITALRRVGVNFNKTQTEIIKHLAETGHVAQAQARILKELQTEFAGSAKAAANADPLFRYHKIMEELQLSVGHVAMQLLQKLTPALEWVGTAFKNTIDWLREHSDLLKTLGVAIGIAAGAYIVYRGILLAGTIATAVNTAVTSIQIAAMYTLGTAYESAGIMTKLLAAAQYALNAAMEANPIGIIIAALVAVGTAVYYCWNHFAKFRAVLFGVWETIKEFGRIVGDIFTGLWHTIHGVFTFNGTEIKNGLLQQVDAISNAGTRLGGAFKKGFDDGMDSFSKDHATENAPKAITKKAAAAVTPPTNNDETKKGKVVGNKATTINITIGSLVKELKVTTMNMTEGAAKIKEMVTQALLSAVNDSQIVAGQ